MLAALLSRKDREIKAVHGKSPLDQLPTRGPRGGALDLFSASSPRDQRRVGGHVGSEMRGAGAGGSATPSQPTPSPPDHLCMRGITNAQQRNT